MARNRARAVADVVALRSQPGGARRTDLQKNGAMLFGRHDFAVCLGGRLAFTSGLEGVHAHAAYVQAAHHIFNVINAALLMPVIHGFAASADGAAAWLPPLASMLPTPWAETAL